MTDTLLRRLHDIAQRGSPSDREIVQALSAYLALISSLNLAAKVRDEADQVVVALINQRRARASGHLSKRRSQTEVDDLRRVEKKQRTSKMTRKKFQPVPVRGEPASVTLLRDRR